MFLKQVRLNGVATFIGSIGLIVAASVLVILLVRYGCYLYWLLLLFFQTYGPKLTLCELCMVSSLFYSYFTGHTKDIRGGPQFVKGKTKIGHVIDDVVKVITVAVCFLVNNISLIGSQF